MAPGMSAGLGALSRDVLQTAFRLAPWPTEPGLRRAGSPSDLSPVIVTGNYDLTVRRVMRALRGIDAWVVVAPAGGINVWCAASGGHLTTHQVVTALKTSGVADRVRHRRAILPQLAATGVIARDVSRRCGWRVRFGPVRADDLPEYLAKGGRKSDAMRRVRFGPRERLEMAAVWAAPTALLVGALALALRPAWCLPLVLWTALLSLAAFFLYERAPGPRRTVFAGTAALLAVGAVASAGGGAASQLAAVTASVALVGLLTFDYDGSTPIRGGSHFEERQWQVRLDPARCKGVYRCWAVCPEACFERREDRRIVDFAHDERCIRCGACVVQCPMDALAFEADDGRRIEPDVIRRYKLNLLGRRSVSR
jgi:ferredoxin